MRIVKRIIGWIGILAAFYGLSLSIGYTIVGKIDFVTAFIVSGQMLMTMAVVGFIGWILFNFINWAFGD